MSKPTQVKQTATIKDWVFFHRQLSGTIVTHPRLPTSMYIRTSAIVSIDMENKLVETLNTVYKLHGDGYKGGGDPDKVVLATDEEQLKHWDIYRHGE